MHDAAALESSKICKLRRLDVGNPVTERQVDLSLIA